MTHHDHDKQDKAWELAESIKFCMFITWDGERQRARPMASQPAKEEHAIYFLTDEESAKSHQIDRFPIITLAYADKSHNEFVSITGRAEVSDDREKIRELFSPFAKAWWDSPDDPQIRVIKVTPEDAEYWDSPSGPMANMKMLSAIVTGGRPDMGDNEKVDF